MGEAAERCCELVIVSIFLVFLIDFSLGTRIPPHSPGLGRTKVSQPSTAGHEQTSLDLPNTSPVIFVMIPERTRNKFVILGTGDALALFEHLSPEQVPEVSRRLQQHTLKDPEGIAYVANFQSKPNTITMGNVF